LGRECRRQKEYFRDVFQFGLCYDIMGQQETEVSHTQHSRKQKSLALNTVEAEYIAACEACTEAVWLRKLISGLFEQVPDSIVIYCDNQSCMRLSEHPAFHDRSKHIEIKYYFIHDKLQEGEVKLSISPQMSR
jgi:hypothetical protein